MSSEPVDVLERLKQLPPVAYLDNAGGCRNTSTDAPVVAVRRGVMGCYPIYTRRSAFELNDQSGVTPAQAEAMYVGSMFGWEVPGADPALQERLLASRSQAPT